MCSEAVLLDSVLKHTVPSLKDRVVQTCLVSHLLVKHKTTLQQLLTAFEKHVNCGCPEAAGLPQPSLHRPCGTVPRAVVPGRRSELQED